MNFPTMFEFSILNTPNNKLEASLYVNYKVNTLELITPLY